MRKASKRIAVFAKYGDLAASTRQRLLQYFPQLEAAGFELEVFSLIENAQLQARFEGRGSAAAKMISRYGVRVAQVLASRRHDLIWIYCELFPYLPGFVERLARLSGVPLVYDYDDAIFHQYDGHASSAVRALLGRKLQPVMRQASLVVAGNDYLASYARQFCDNVAVIPTVIDADEYQLDLSRQPERKTIGWIGSPSTWNFVKQKLDVLENACAAHDATLKVVGAGAQADGIDFICNARWRESEEVADIQAMHVGIMPLDDSPFARGKCGYKLIQYMACGLPVVASPVGVNRSIVEHGVNGFLAETPQEWRDALGTILKDRALAKRMGAAGRKKVAREYSVQVTGPRLVALMRGLTS
ncbi:glycosyltransferase family 4 protein [Aestuariivirga litoralis]|uniref:glycosyltransferase family 4 protein n=1 Tax=Aestuariivirga litoralis TaxID=2650924 RepID=UPI0018C72C17|nr:glycosyltransferase family 4 protein [Aestuariivirga litoralis]MBG1233236.1 glycosyltransferase family 4 protein [Aestuariivirga litoralis]